jgi:type III restriction enzyme
MEIIVDESVEKLNNRMKGAEFDMDHAKYQADRRWVSAVNNWRRLGKWDFMVCKDPLALPGMLASCR